MGLVTRCCDLTLAKSQASTRVAHFQSKAAGKTLEFSALALPFREGRGVKMNFWNTFICAAIWRKKPNITKPTKRKDECSCFFLLQLQVLFVLIMFGLITKLCCHHLLESLTSPAWLLLCLYSGFCVLEKPQL